MRMLWLPPAAMLMHGELKAGPAMVQHMLQPQKGGCVHWEDDVKVQSAAVTKDAGEHCGQNK